MDLYEFRARQDSRVAPELEDLAKAVIGAAIEVHRALGPGLMEVHYQKALSHELALRRIPHRFEAEFDVTYKQSPIGKCRMDLLVADQLIVELKAVEALTQTHRAQALTYLRLTGITLALVINFNVPILKDGIKRVINTL